MIEGIQARRPERVHRPLSPGILPEFTWRKPVGPTAIYRQFSQLDLIVPDSMAKATSGKARTPESSDLLDSPRLESRHDLGQNPFGFFGVKIRLIALPDTILGQEMVFCRLDPMPGEAGTFRLLFRD